MTSLSTYRLARPFVLRALGVNLVVAGVTVFAAFLLWTKVTPLAVVFAIAAAVAVLNAVRLVVWPPPVARLDDTGMRLGGRLTSSAARLPWADVQGVEADERRATITRTDGGVVVFALAFAGKRRVELLREIHDRLNTANGYRKF